MMRRAQEPADAPVSEPRRAAWAPFLAGVALTMLTAVLLNLAPFGKPDVGEATPALWEPIVASKSPAIVSFGVPLFYAGDGFFVRDIQVNAPGQEMDSGIERIGRAMAQLLRPHDDVYTGIGETVGIYEIGRFLEQRGVRVQISNSHYLGAFGSTRQEPGDHLEFAIPDAADPVPSSGGVSFSARGDRRLVCQPRSTAGRTAGV